MGSEMCIRDRAETARRQRVEHMQRQLALRRRQLALQQAAALRVRAAAAAAGAVPVAVAVAVAAGWNPPLTRINPEDSGAHGLQRRPIFRGRYNGLQVTILVKPPSGNRLKYVAYVQISRGSGGKKMGIGIQHVSLETCLQQAVDAVKNNIHIFVAQARDRGDI